MLSRADGSPGFLLQRVEEELARTQHLSARLRRTHTALVSGSILTSALTAGLAGLTAAQGPLVGQGPPAWRWTCGIVAGISAISALLTGAHQRFTVAERLASARACAGQLRALEFGLRQGGRDAVDGARQYEEIVSRYADLQA